jgi:hypothetical protein
MLPRIPITMAARPKLQLHQILQISLLIRLISLFQLLLSSFNRGRSGDVGSELILLLRELVALEVFAGETGPREGEPDLLWDLQVLTDGCLCRALFQIEPGDLCGGGGISLFSRLASMSFFTCE